jgi:bacillithiol system protein YtxJ
MTIQPLTTTAELEAALTASEQQPVLLFKHSTRCPISSAAQAQFHAFAQAHHEPPAAAYELDLLRHRDVSLAIVERLGVRHESPQALVVRHGRAVWHASHYDITAAALTAAVSAH